MHYKEIIEQRKREKVNNPVPANNNEAEESFNNDYFGVESIRNLPACIDYRLADGDFVAIPYSLLNGINYNPDKGIEITYANCSVRVIGYNLRQLYYYLALYRVRYVQIAYGQSLEVNENIVITSIEISVQ